MNFLRGIQYNLRGLLLGLKTPKLLALGIARFLILLITSVICIWMVLAHHNDLLNLLWQKPQSAWILWLWHVVAWLLAFFMVGISTIFSYLFAQLLFSVLIMDLMSRITEKIINGTVQDASENSILKLFLFLMKQEIPRTIIPMVCLFVLMVIGWLTPLAPIVSAIASCTAVIFLSWDHTDLTPARRMVPFRDRFSSLLETLPFHLGFGIWFLIPVLNILFLSFAPVGATLFSLKIDLNKMSPKA